MKQLWWIHLPAGGPPVAHFTPGTLQDWQGAVGGYLEAVMLTLFEPVLVMYCNEHGKLDGLPPNPVATFLARSHWDIIVGDVVLAGPVGPDGEHLPLPPKGSLVVNRVQGGQ